MADFSLKNVFDGSKTSQGPSLVSYVINATNNKTLSRMAKDSIFQFSTICSSSIDTDELGVICKSIEQTYASMLMSVLSLNATVDRRKYPTLTQYLKSFHNSGLIGGNDPGSMFSIDSYTITCNGHHVATPVIESLWETLEDGLDMSNVNNIYKPYTKTKAILKKSYDLIQATEANNTDPFRNKGKLGTILDGRRRNPYTINGEYGLNATFNGDVNKLASDKDKDKDGNLKGSRMRVIEIKNHNEITKSDKLANMEPTMITITFSNVMPGKVADVWTQTVNLGVKTMPRLVKTNLMVQSIIDMCKDRLVFKIIKWTKGEIKASQAISELTLGLQSAKKEARDMVDKKKSWVAALKRRKFADSVQKLIGKRLLPNTTIIITEAEAEMVRSQCGIDIMESRTIKKIMNKYFLLGFGVYDTEAKVLNIIYDSDEAYASYALSGLIALTKKEINASLR